MGNNSHKPAIRFQGFTDAWEQRKLGDIADTKTGPFGTQLSAKEYTASGIPVINVKNIGTGCIQENDLDYVSESTAKRLSDHIIQENDIVFGRKGAIGRHAIIGKTQNNWVQGSDCIRVRFKPGIVASYVNAQLQTANVIDHLSMNAYGSTMLTLTTDMINSIPLLMPEEAEQSEIAHVFSDIDNLITLHQRKYQKLITVKKSMLEKMFPRDGSNNPEIRFIGFTDPWEQRKVKDVAPLQRGFDLPTSQMEKGPYPVIMSNGIGGYHSQYRAKGPGVVTGRSGTIGKLHYIEDDYWPHNTSLWVTNFNGNYPKFVYHLYQLLDLSHYGTGSGVPTLNRNDVHDAKVFIPSLDEQKQISKILDTIDNLITLHQRKLEKLKNIKQSLLQNMFV